jgi:hypothetical protein
VATKIEQELAQLLEILDEKSRAILWHLWWHGHAEIPELRDIIDAPGDFEVLHRLKEVINGKAQQLWGKPIVGFEQSKTDPLTGEKVLFSWWFLDEESIPLSGKHKPLLDVFNEKDSVTIIAQLPTSVELTHPDIQFKNGILKVKMKKEGKNVKNRLGGNQRKAAPSRVYGRRNGRGQEGPGGGDSKVS